MPTTDDPFAHHPELRDEISPATESFFRDFKVDDLIADNPDLEALRDWFNTDAEREATRRSILDRVGNRDLWIFAYGSLMWDPALEFAEVRRVCVPGWARRFILLDDKGGRGTKEAPGLMAALDDGDRCDGLAFRIRAEDVDKETEILWRREMIGPGYQPTMVTCQIDDDATRLLTFAADHGSDVMCSDLSRDQTVHYIATGAGMLGSSRDYLANIVGHFDTLDIVDAYCSRLLRDVDRYRSKIKSEGAAQ